MEFTTLQEFRKVYTKTRDNIIERHGYKNGTSVRLKNAVALLQNFDGIWIKVGTVKSDMEERIRMYNGRASFKLVALV